MSLHTPSCRLPSIIVAFVLACVVARAVVCAQTQAAAAEASASVSGRVMLEEKGVAGVAVGLISSERGPLNRRRAVAKAMTDDEGRYRISGIRPGRYYVIPSAPAFVVADFRPEREPGKAVLLEPGDEAEDVNFTLARGGVIAGRVTDADGKPIVAEYVSLTPVDEQTEVRLPNIHAMSQTDDRGQYRLFGLPAGRYHVSVGHDEEGGINRRGGARGYHRRTFHPDTTERERAKIVEVTAGGEATDVDIKLGKLSDTFRARGRIVHAATGQPAPNLTFGYGPVLKDAQQFYSQNVGMQTNARGEFQLDGLIPGRYGVFADEDGRSELYSEVVTFEVVDSDVTGIEVKLSRGATLSGVVAIEGASDRALAARLLGQLTLGHHNDSRDTLAPHSFHPVSVNPDGSFRIKGLRPGRVHISGGYPPTKGLSLARVERDGVEQRGGVEIAEGAQVSGVRVVFGYGTGVVRGQVVVTNGGQPARLPEGSRMWVYTRASGGGSGRGRPTEVDARGRFLLEGLPAGEQELMVQAVGRTGGARASQTISVPEDGEVSVTLTIDLGKDIQGGRP